MAVVESELDILSDMMKRVVEKDISPDLKLMEMIYTHLDAVKEVVYRNGTLRANFFRDIWRVEKVRKRFDANEILISGMSCAKEWRKACSISTIWT